MSVGVEALYEAARRAGLLVEAEVGGLCVWVDFRATDEAVLEGLALSADYTLRFPASALPTLAVGEIVTVRGVGFRLELS